NLGRVAAAQGDFVRATASLEEGLRLSRDRGDRREIVAGVEELAVLACAQEQLERTARLFGAAELMRELICARRPPADQARSDQCIAAARVGLGEVPFAVAWDDGRSMTWEQAVAEALNAP
ncbi:MAG: hypothetical protein JOZ81_33965, partial [Chloroflexi bacterium]|nr:hypothetical protein [Chloroflexota bacterium]